MGIAQRLRVDRGASLSPEQWADHEVVALVQSRLSANESGRSCDAEWHRKNGYV
jgi:hypothetical protein